MPDCEALLGLFNHLPDVVLFVKDLERRLVYGNGQLLEKLKLSSLSELVGTRDEEYFPAEICESFRQDDEEVLKQGNSIVDHLELAFDGDHAIDWYVTTKLPARDANGKVKGLVGITRSCADPDLIARLSSDRGLQRLMQWLRENSDRRVSIDEMAQMASMAVSELRDKTKATLGITPRELEIGSRIKLAGDALRETQTSIADLAIRFGFYDQSAFTNQFKKRTGITPREYRHGRRVEN